MSDSIKKRKWDQDDHGDNSKASKLNKVDVDPSKAAIEAAARINAMLAQKGIPLHEVEKKDGAFVKDIPINDLKNRYMLIKGATHTQIHEETGADVITRGKYYPDKSLATEKEPPLYLHVSASSKESLDKAVKQIEELIETAQVPTPGSFSDHKNDMRRNERKFYEKILPVEVSGTPHFNLRAKIVGPSGAYVKHINQETGCRVQLKGRGSGFLETSTGRESDEPLHVHLSCPREEGLLAGIKLTQDLLDTVKQEAERGPQYQYGYNRGGYSNGGYGGSYNYDYSQTGASATPPPPPPATAAAVGAPPAPGSGASGTTNTTGEYDYEAYRDYYSNYYQQDPNAYQQYDANAYYGYYGYSSADGDSASAPPPPASTNSHSPPPPSASGVPPPPPSASGIPPPPPSASGIPPPPPPGATSPPPASSLPPPPPPTA